MFFLWLELAILVLVLVTVGAMCVFLVLDDPGIMNWLRTHKAELVSWAKFYIVRYKHQPRHSPQHIERQREWYLQSLAFSAT